jgi:hypothetical protein
MKKTLILLSLFAVSGCGIAAKVQAREAYQQATVNYNNCLQSNQGNMSACEADRQIMISDREEYNAFSAGIQTGGIRTLNVNSQ